ncbi:MAG: CARDB domain-containing protein [Candidatus Bathyarchaeia archaeon]
MNVKLKKLAVLTIATILLSLSLPNMKIAFSDTSGKMDLFTQKEPYSGKGPNMPSDAFSPQEHVILYALVTRNEAPMQNALVAFYIRAPTGFSFSLSEKTNASGIATINFTIPHPCDNESEFFGEWYTLANAYVGDTLVQDSLTFRVDWIVKLISVRTIDENLSHRIDFGIGGDVGLEITLRSIAKTVKNATIYITLQDELDAPVSSYEICDFKVQPNEKPVFLYCKLYIPKWAVVGEATILVSALNAPANASEVPYCPTILTKFYILPYAPLTITFHDVAVVDAVPSVRSVEAGEIVNISAIIQNEGTENESFNVSAYYDDYLIETLSATLASHSWTTLNFTFNTTAVASANYTIKVSIPPLTNEADLTDNTFVDGMVEVKLPIVVRNIGIVKVKTSADTLYIGDLLQINVSVVNKGTETETFNVKVYYNDSLIETKVVNALPPTVQHTLTFMWSTSSVSEGLYQVSASAPLDGDIDPSDNTLVNGIVQVKTKLLPVHDIAVLNVVPSSSMVYIGEIVEVNVTVKNKGDEFESFNVTLRYNSTVADTLFVDNLAPKTNHTLVFHWDTHGFSEGNYTLIAYAHPVPDEEYTEDNSFVNGVVKVVKVPTGWFVPEWFYWFLLLILVLIILLLVLLLYRRKKRRETEAAFRSGWTAWYYCRNLRCKLAKIKEAYCKGSLPLFLCLAKMYKRGFL